jgi:hypothetical protein
LAIAYILKIATKEFNMSQSALSQTIHCLSKTEGIDKDKSSFKRFSFRIAENEADFAIAKNILEDAHQSRSHLKIDFPPAKDIYSAKSITFILEENRTPVGTFSLIIDSTNQLPADLTFSNELSAYRGQNRFLSEICSLGVTKECQFKRDMMFFAIFLATMQNFALKISDCVVTVKENHKHFYNGLNFFDLSAEKTSARTGAKVQLLAINNQIAAQNSGINQNTFSLQKKNTNRPQGFWKYIHRNIDELYIAKVLNLLMNDIFLIETEEEILSI